MLSALSSKGPGETGPNPQNVSREPHRNNPLVPNSLGSLDLTHPPALYEKIGKHFDLINIHNDIATDIPPILYLASTKHTFTERIKKMAGYMLHFIVKKQKIDE